MTQRVGGPKKIGKSDITGALGVNIIERRLLEMGYLWYPSGGVEAGIDGRLEIRAESGEVTNLVISVQSKATDGEFQSETPSHFSFGCSERDLQYWLRGNLPVILVCSRPRTDEAYWVSIRDYFADPLRKSSKTIRFSKSDDAFDLAAAEKLRRIAVPTDGGHYLGAQPRREVVFSDLLPLREFPNRYFRARAIQSSRKDAINELYAVYPKARFTRAFIVHDETIYSFFDLSERWWEPVAETGTVESDLTFEWSMNTDPVRRNLFVELLNVTLQEQLREDDIFFSKLHGFFYHRASDDLSDVRRTYMSRRKEASRDVFKRYQSKLDPNKTSYYRHSAFIGHFLQLDGNWFLQITPTYRFTRDGQNDSRFSSEALSGIKRLENNQAVHGQVVMWGALLKTENLFNQHNMLKFLPLLQFAVDSGFNDSDWLKREDAEKQANQEEDAELFLEPGELGL
jgi:hypothetical protein